jgi:tetratricopeptide (TPR) repeat protein
LTNYVKSQYLAEKLDRIDRSEPTDLWKQFELILESDKPRGVTDKEKLSIAIALIRGYINLEEYDRALLDQSFAWRALGRFAEADPVARDRLKRLPDDPAAMRALVFNELGCLYAEVGKTKEALEVLVQAMNALDLDQPDDNYGYAFGRIAEQYGESAT